MENILLFAHPTYPILGQANKSIFTNSLLLQKILSKFGRERTKFCNLFSEQFILFNAGLNQKVDYQNIKLFLVSYNQKDSETQYFHDSY